MGGGSNSNMEEERRQREQDRLNRGRRGGSSASDDEDFEAEASSLAPGMMWVGLGGKTQMLENARKLNLDVLCIFEVKVRHTERRNGETSTKTNTRLVVYSV